MSVRRLVTLPADLRAITLVQPMGWAIWAKKKPIENRPQDLPLAMRGMRTIVALHNGAKWDDGYGMQVHLLTGSVPAKTAPSIIALMTLTGRVFVHGLPAHRSRQMLSHWVDSGAATDDQLAWLSGPFGYEIDLDETYAIQPVPCSGMLGFWRVQPNIVDLIEERLYEARDHHV